jgi:C4-dicarboxylate transporter, DctM subunit
MSPNTIAIISIGLLLLLFFLRMPVSYAMALVGFAGFSYVTSMGGAFRLIAKDFFYMFANYDLAVVPMFVFMGSLAFYSGISKRLFDAAYKFLGQLPGGLAIATCYACAAFGACCGSTTAAAAAMGKVTLPFVSYGLRCCSG